MTDQAITLNDALSDVELRFLANLPEVELSKVDRLLFWIQEAHWFYDDFYCDNYESLPRTTFKQFTKLIFQHCPLFKDMNNDVNGILASYQQYKSKIPVCGCIILNPTMTKILLVCSWNTNSWTFPRGKLNENEESIDCSIREVYEETGLDITPYIDRQELHQIESDEGNKSITLFIVPNVGEDIVFEPQSRKEISSVKFFSINSIPNESFAVKQFIKPLRQWISQNKTRRYSFDDTVVGSSKKSSSLSKKDQQNHYNKNMFNTDTFHGDSAKKWSVDQMFAANANITGRSYEYNGNPHEFGSSHPRYVNYNSDDSVSISKHQRERQNTSSSLGEELDLDLLALQSNQFHTKRKSVSIEDLTKDSVEYQQPSAWSAEKASRSKSSSAVAKSAQRLTIPVKAVQPKQSVKKQAFSLTVPFRFNRDVIMTAFDKAW